MALTDSSTLAVDPLVLTGARARSLLALWRWISCTQKVLVHYWRWLTLFYSLVDCGVSGVFVFLSGGGSLVLNQCSRSLLLFLTLWRWILLYSLVLAAFITGILAVDFLYSKGARSLLAVADALLLTCGPAALAVFFSSLAVDFLYSLSARVHYCFCSGGGFLVLTVLAFFTATTITARL